MKYQNFFEGVAVVEGSFADQYINQGVENEKIKTAKNSILTGLPNETIKIITGLSFQQINKIREELKTFKI